MRFEQINDSSKFDDRSALCLFAMIQLDHTCRSRRKDKTQEKHVNIYKRQV